MEDMNVCFVCNGHNFAINMSITIISILKNSNENDKFHFHIITSDLSDEDKNNIILLKEIKDFKITFYEPDPKRLEIYKEWARIAGNRLAEYWSYHIFLKFEVFFLFQDYDTILFMDADIIVFKNINFLFDIDIGKYYAINVGFDNNVIYHSDPFVTHFFQKDKNRIKSDKKIEEIETYCFTIFNIKLLKDIYTIKNLQDFFNKIKDSDAEYIVEDSFNRYFIGKENTMWIDDEYQADVAIWRKEEYCDNLFAAHCSCGKIFSNEFEYIPSYKNKILRTGWIYLTMTQWFKDDPLYFLEHYSKYSISNLTKQNQHQLEQQTMDLHKKLEKQTSNIHNLTNKIVWIIPIKKIRDQIRNKLFQYLDT